ncbi:hypothetical protein GF386_02890 [Candidatus Pacearchaeota archaeon]|nr:hypothetical protein [Candidatus Pacearchaeota archaeon]MBD3283095.1 hypothetical protein [Candidatus Pacearchaeota archaeon]
MKRGIFVLILILSISFVYAECFDTDGDLGHPERLEVRGYCQDASGEYGDYTGFSSGVLYEYYCGPEHYPEEDQYCVSEEYICSDYGYSNYGDGYCTNEEIAGNCTDHDGGRYYHWAGYAENDTGSYYDTCIDDVDLKEYYCESGVLKSEIYSCPGGCEDNQCNIAASDTCLDLDGGKDVYKAATAENDNFKLTDYCSFSENPKGDLYEAICCETDEPIHEKLTCPSDSPYCNKGACSSTKPVCTDSDGGKDTRVKGTVTEPKQFDGPKHTDYCYNVNTKEIVSECLSEYSQCGVREYYCSENSPVSGYEDITCPGDCKYGACLESGSSQEEEEENEETFSHGSSQCVFHGYKCTSSIEGCGHYTQLEFSCDSFTEICCDGVPRCGDGVCFEHEIPSYRETPENCPQDCGGSGMVSCLENPSNYWDQETNTCYEGYSSDKIKGSCSESDGGKSLYKYGSSYGFRSPSSIEKDSDLRVRASIPDVCLSNHRIRESFCTEEGYLDYHEENCEWGCKEGRCVGESEAIPDEEPETIGEEEEYECEGCYAKVENRKFKLCYETGYRTSDKYCSTSGRFIAQKEADRRCQEDYECESNNCEDKKCSKKNFFLRIVDWFKGLFGFD